MRISPNTNGARGRIALSGGGLRPRGTGRRVQKSHLLRERAEPMVRPRGSQGIRRKPEAFLRPLVRLPRWPVPLGFGGNSGRTAAGRDVMAIKVLGAGGAGRAAHGIGVCCRPGQPRQLPEPPGHLRRAVSRRRRARRVRAPACAETVRADGPALRDREPAGRRNRHRRQPTSRSRRPMATRSCSGPVRPLPSTSR